VGRSGADSVSSVLEQALSAKLGDFAPVLLAALAEIIPVDHSGYYEFDPQANRFVVARHPVGSEVPPDIKQRSAELIAEHPLFAHHESAGGGARRISDVMSQEEYHATRFYRDVNSHLGAEHQMAFRLPGPQPLIIGVVMSRTDRDFTESERDLCELLRAPLAAIHARATREALLHETVEYQVASDSAAALIACEGEHLIALDDRATYLVARLQRLDTPAGVAFTAWLRDARAGDVALEDPLPDRHHTTWTDDLGSLEIRHIPGREGRDLLVVRDLDPDLAAVLQTLGLRPREAAVLELVMTGCNNHQIARRLAITQGTVKKHLENTYRTLGVSTRTAAAAAGFQAINHGSPPRE
jgi:DNA-binding CsgD family transcriptional regulator/GAF domain-containing protein